jgi:hypothetical protein
MKVVIGRKQDRVANLGLAMEWMNAEYVVVIIPVA